MSYLRKRITHAAKGQLQADHLKIEKNLRTQPLRVLDLFLRSPILTIKSNRCNLIVKYKVYHLPVQQSIQSFKSHPSDHFYISHLCSETKASLTICTSIIGKGAHA